MLVIAAVTNPDWNTRKGAGDRFCVWRIFASKRRDRGKQGGLTTGKSPNAVGTDAKSSEHWPAANEAGCRQALHDLLNGHKRMLPSSSCLGRNDKERKKLWVMKQVVLRLLDLTRKTAAAGDCCECL
jgi:hypothetical protein